MASPASGLTAAVASNVTADGLQRLAETAVRGSIADAVVITTAAGHATRVAARAGIGLRTAACLAEPLESPEELSADCLVDIRALTPSIPSLRPLQRAGYSRIRSVPLRIDSVEFGRLHLLQKRLAEETDEALARALASHAAVMLAESAPTQRDRVMPELPGLEQLLLSIGSFQELTPAIDAALAPLLGDSISTGVMLYDEERDLLQMVPGSFGANASVAASYQIATTNARSNAARVFVTDRPYFSNFADGDPAILQDYVQAFDIKRLLSLPLSANGQRVGVLHIANKQTDFTVDDLWQMEVVIPRIATVVAVTARISQLRRQQQLEQIISDVAVALASGKSVNDFLAHALDEICAVTEASFISFIPHQDVPTIWRHGDVDARHEAQVLEQGRATARACGHVVQPLHAGDPGWATFHAPVRLADQRIGTFSAYRGRGEPFSLTEQRALSRLADLAALAWTMERYQQQRAELARIDERERIADELHDDVAQKLFSAQMTIDAALQTGAMAAETRASILRARTLVMRSDEALRDVIRQFSREPSDDLLQRLSAAVADIERSFSVPIHLEVTDDAAARSGELARPAREALVKVARESLANAAKHAGPCRAAVTVRVSKGRIVLQVIDDGMGMANARPSNGHGLTSLRRMIRDQGGYFRVQANPHGGTRVTASIGLRADS